jgi:hypothetical protein
MLPGKIRMKKNPVIQPISLLYRHKNINDNPKKISTTPEARTTKSSSTGIHEGTCA